MAAPTVACKDTRAHLPCQQRGSFLDLPLPLDEILACSLYFVRAVNP